jgi:hypothetical protein
MLLVQWHPSRTSTFCLASFRVKGATGRLSTCENRKFIGEKITMHHPRKSQRPAVFFCVLASVSACCWCNVTFPRLQIFVWQALEKTAPKWESMNAL